jgi:N-acetylmuramoyl-L-alanine amidase
MRFRILVSSMAVLASAGTASMSAADGPSSAAVSLTAVRSWASPAGTRVVFDFSGEVIPVAPDSGDSREVVVAVPGAPVVRADAVPATLTVRDSVVDSVEIACSELGARFRINFADTTRFRVFTLRASDDKPFRLVVDVTRPGAAAREAARLARAVNGRKRDRVRIVAVDAGHGGRDFGARRRRGPPEKTITLGIARRFVDELNRIPGIRAALVRDGDVFIPLRDRYRAAETMKADLFISIHANSSPQRVGHGRGTEVWFLSLHGASDQAGKDLADMENAADMVGGVPSQADDDLVSLLYDVKRTSVLQQSQLLAGTLLDNLSEDRRVETHAVKQAGFAVLKSVEFPSVLVETGFINNPQELKLLADPVFQKRMAQELATGVKSYFQRSGFTLAVPAGESATEPSRR